MKRTLFVWLAIATLFLDQVTKIVVHAMYRAGTLNEAATTKLVGDVLRIAYVKNQQGIFGLAYGPRVFYVLLPLLVAAGVVWLGMRARDRWTAAACGVLLGGGIGNLIDRVRLGYVIDFVVFTLRRLDFRWYTFNVADACLIAGVIMLMGHEILGRPRPSGQDGPRQAPSA